MMMITELVDCIGAMYKALAPGDTRNTLIGCFHTFGIIHVPINGLARWKRPYKINHTGPGVTLSRRQW